MQRVVSQDPPGIAVPQKGLTGGEAEWEIELWQDGRD